MGARMLRKRPLPSGFEQFKCRALPPTKCRSSTRIFKIYQFTINPTAAIALSGLAARHHSNRSDGSAGPARFEGALIGPPPRFAAQTETKARVASEFGVRRLPARRFRSSCRPDRIRLSRWHCSSWPLSPLHLECAFNPQIICELGRAAFSSHLH